MNRPGGWWGRKSTPAKVETYTRWSFHSFALIELLTAGGPVIGQAGPRPAAVLLLMVTAHSVLCAVTASRTLDWLRGGREQPVRTLWALGGVTVAVAVASLAAVTHGPAGRDVDGPAGGVFTIVLVFGSGVVALGVR
ncbi:sensor histidine kinase, partial [Streptomyces sp. G35A]